MERGAGNRVSCMLVLASRGHASEATSERTSAGVKGMHVPNSASPQMRMEALTVKRITEQKADSHSLFLWGTDRNGHGRGGEKVIRSGV